MTPPKKDSGEATEAEEKPEVAVVDENALPGEVWVENAHIFEPRFPLLAKAHTIAIRLRTVLPSLCRGQSSRRDRLDASRRNLVER
jgi:hypothetical protein